jgi:glycosyltransferase involved in cell wall biosynthesis
VLEHFSHYLPEDRVMTIAEQARAEALTGSGPLDVTGSPLVSVVMPVYNGERYLRVAVQSLLRQTLQQIEILVINDGSTDHTEQILGELAADPRVRPVHQPHLGIPRARNTGIALAKAKHIAVHDADDLSLPDRLAKQYAFLEQVPEVAAVGSLANVVDETGQFIRSFGGVPTDPAQIVETLPTRNCLVHGSVLMRTSAIEAVGKYREAFALAHDYDLYLRLADHFQLANLAEVLYLYRDHADSASHTHKKVQRAYADIAQELAEERQRTGSDLLQREGYAAFLNAYETRLQEASLPEELVVHAR